LRNITEEPRSAGLPVAQASLPPHEALGQKGKAAPSLPPGCAEKKFFAS